jgi:hypothetical protein
MIDKIETFISSFHNNLGYYIDYMDNGDKNDEEELISLSIEDKKLYKKLYKPDIIFSGSYIRLNNFDKIQMDTEKILYFSDIKKMINNLYEDKDKAIHLPKLLNEIQKEWDLYKIDREPQFFYMEYENNDLKYITYVNRYKKNAIKFHVDGIEGLEKLLMYDNSMFHDQTFLNKYQTLQEKITYFNDHLKYVNILSKGLEEYDLFPDLSTMICTNYI